jgi:hypothetical protein
VASVNHRYRGAPGERIVRLIHKSNEPNMERKKIFAVIIFFLFHIPALGCVCASYPSVADSLKHFDAVFSAKFISITDKKAKAEVFEVWKGNVTSEITMLLGGSEYTPKGKETIKYPFTSCDHEFKVGDEYLIYAWQVEGQFYRT